jgi:hypothetical protein
MSHGSKLVGIGSLVMFLFVNWAAAADDVKTVVRDHVRFQVLSGRVLRMEYSPTSHFVDEASVAVVGRNGWSDASLKIEERDGWLTLITPELAMAYQSGTGPFSPANLRVTWKDVSGEHVWQPVFCFNGYGTKWTLS